MTDIEKALVKLDYYTSKYLDVSDADEKKEYKNLCEYWQSVLMCHFDLTVEQINQMTYGKDGIIAKGLRKM